MVDATRVPPWDLQADLGALIALKNNRDRIYADPAVAQTVVSGAERIARSRLGTQPGATIGSRDVEASMKASGLEFRTAELVVTFAPHVKPQAVTDALWGD